MAEFRQGWAVVVRDFTPVDGEDADIVTVLRARLREASAARDCLHYIEATEVEQPLI